MHAETCAHSEKILWKIVKCKIQLQALERFVAAFCFNSWACFGTLFSQQLGRCRTPARRDAIPHFCREQLWYSHRDWPCPAEQQECRNTSSGQKCRLGMLQNVGLLLREGGTRPMEHWMFQWCVRTRGTWSFAAPRAKFYKRKLFADGVLPERAHSCLWLHKEEGEDLCK